MAGAIIGGAIGGLGSIAGGKAQADATETAARLQAQSNTDALNFAKQRYGQLQTNEQPYMKAGVAASAGIGDVLARAAQRSGYSYAPANQTVLLQAPDGSVQQKPAGELNHWLQLGAKQIQTT